MTASLTASLVQPVSDSEELTGMIAWYYEHEGLRPMMVGHSQEASRR